MDPNERKADEFFETLAGRSDADPGARAMREASLAQARTLREAEGASANTLSDDERAAMTRATQALAAAGALSGPRQASTRTLAQKLRALLFGTSWQRPLGIAAALVLSTVLVLQFWSFERDDGGVRGTNQPVLIANDPEARARALAETLRSAGAEVLLAQINQGEWVLQIEAGDPSKENTVRAILLQAGVKVDGHGPFKVSVRREAR